jgi:hypothetical protein
MTTNDERTKAEAGEARHLQLVVHVGNVMLGLTLGRMEILPK